MPFFRKKTKIACVPCDVPGWEDPQFASLARQWAMGTGLSENWSGRLQQANPPQVVEVLGTVPVEKGAELTAVSRRGWILLSAYRCMCQKVETLIREKLTLEKENAELQSKLAMLQCQNFILGDQARGYQSVAEKAAVRCAQYKYKKRRGRVNSQKVHALIATAGVNWDPDTWDGDIWDDTDDDEVNWADLEEEEAHKYDQEKYPPRVQSGPLQAKPLQGRQEKVRGDQREYTIITEDFSQQEITDILTKFSQKPRESLLSWMIQITDTGAGGISVDHVGAHSTLNSADGKYNAEADRLATIAEVNLPPPLEGLAKWIHTKTGHAGTHAMYRWAQDRGLSTPLSELRQVVEHCPTCQLDKNRALPLVITGELHGGQAPAQIWQIDYIGPLPQSRGCQYICTCVDTYSGVLVACAYRRAVQKNTIKTLEIIALYYGMPMQIQSDNGSHFKGKQIQDYAEQNNIEWIYHIPYYPQAAGLIERMNGLLKEKLRKLGNNSYNNWKDNLFEALQQLNNRPIGPGLTPLMRMMTPNSQIRKIYTFQEIQWWKIDDKAIMPFRATIGSAGHDLHALEEIWIDPQNILKCRTGIGIKIPQGYYGQIAPRSSLAEKGIQILAGIIDSDYRGEIKIILSNIGKETLHFVPGTQIAQLLIIPCATAKEWTLLDKLPPVTSRLGGLGSTNLIPGAKVWLKRHDGDKPQRAEAIAQGDNNAVIIMLPGQEHCLTVPTNQLFL